MRLKKIFKVLFIILAILVIAISTFLLTLYLGGFGKIPSQSELQELKNENASLIYSDQGKIIGKIYAVNRTNVAYDSIPPFLVEALVATEDARFYEHEGVDTKSLIRVLLKTIILGDKSSGGGSTLSQQLAKNLFGRKKYGKITLLVNKLKEIILANRLENIYTKSEIIELYLNTVPFSENVYGIEAASQRFFNCSVSQLKIEEAAVLVGLLKANSYYNPRLHPENALQRRIVVLNQMKKYDYISQHQYDSLKQLPLSINYSNLGINGHAPYFIAQLKKELQSILDEIKSETGTEYDPEKDGLVINTTLDLNLQKAGLKAMEEHLGRVQPLLRKLYKQGKPAKKLKTLANNFAKQEKINIDSEAKSKHILFSWNKETIADSISIIDSLNHVLTQLHSGILGINPTSGAIKTWVGGIDHSIYPYDQILAKRQLASTFKPFLYAEAINSGMSPCTYLSNEEIVLSDYDNWTPKNYDQSSGGKYSLAAALAYSKNLPTVHLYFQTEWDTLSQLWNKLGFMEELGKDPSIIFGTNSVSMLELATAYSVFANHGKTVDTYSIESIYDKNGGLIYQRKKPTPKQIMASSTTEIINEILMKTVNEGTGSSLRSKYHINIPFAGKTGTSQNFADAWFVGYNQEILLVARVGASYPSIHFTSGSMGSGGRLALPLVGLTLQEALKDQTLNSSLRKAHLKHSNLIDCPDFKEETGLNKFLNSFKKKESSLEKERKKSERKKKRRKLLDLF